MVHSYVRQLEYKEQKVSDSIAIVSGGLDSTVLVYDMISQGYTPHMLSFNYGQRHNKELRFAEYTASRLGLRHDIVDLSGLTRLISNSALTTRRTDYDVLQEGTLVPVEVDGGIEVPEGHYAEDSMKATVVPNRNMMMLSIAAGVAVNNGYRCIAVGVHGGDHFVYPDCRPGFITALDRAIFRGNEGFSAFDGKQVLEDDGRVLSTIYAPYINKTKADIAYRGIELAVPFEETWSCYKGGDKHCGRCGTCVERLEAIDEAESRWNAPFGKFDYDKTQYEDKNFWKEAIKNVH